MWGGWRKLGSKIFSVVQTTTGDPCVVSAEIRWVCSFKSRRGNDRPATMYALSSFRAKPKLLSLMTEVAGNAKFDEDLHQALEENLSLFSVAQFKAELKFVIVKL